MPASVSPAPRRTRHARLAARALPLLVSTLCLPALSGCGGSAARADRPTAARVASGNSRGGGARAASGGRPFAADSIWNRPLGEDATLDPKSVPLVAALAEEAEREEQANNGPWINTTSYGVPILTVPADQPTVRVTLDHAPDAALSGAWRAVPLPADAQPASGTDGYMVVLQPSTDRMWEFWRLNRQEDGWHASWGGAMRHVSTDSGVFGPSAWPGAKPWWGASASSLPLLGGAMTIAELRRGHIDHALSIALPEVRAGVLAEPAQRTDGSSTSPLALPEGAHLRLDPHLDLAALHLPPLVLEMAEAAQRYGIVVRDFAGNITFFGQDPTPTHSNPYAGSDGFYEGRTPAQLLATFPWEHLQVLRMSLRPNP